MVRNDQVRKEPTLADLEAFEKLLRESLQTTPPAEPSPVAAAPVAAASPAPAPAEPTPQPASAMAELNRLVEAPIEFAAPAQHVHGTVEAGLGQEWAATPKVETHFSTPSPPPPPASQPAAPPPAAPAAELDPLAAFEEELRRFDAMRQAEQKGPLGDSYVEPIAVPPAPGRIADPRIETAPAGDDWYAHPAGPAAQTSESAAESSLHAAEERLAAEAAQAAAAAGAGAGSHRSRGIFIALGGIVVAGLALVGGSLVFGSGKKSTTSGDVPVIAAKTDPAKEKPRDPGGMEIPNQNKQVLAARSATEQKPAQVVNNTEQPLDLNQVTRRDSVRVVAPNPFQPGAGTPQFAPETPPATSPAAQPAPGAAQAPATEPRRVTSVRIPVGGGETAPASATSGASAALAATAGAAALNNGATARASTPAPAAPAVTPPKVETRPTTAQPRPETPKVTPPPKVASAPAPAAPKTNPPPRGPNAPLALDPPKTSAAAAPAAGGSGYAIQLASRPTEADARSASTQLRTRYASELGSRAPSVVSGEANGQTVYRVRVGGYSQAAAVEACKKIKAAGGGCFVTKQ